MSTALQAAPHQPASLASPPLAGPSGCQYMSPHASPNREAYHANQTATTSPSRRPPTRKMSGHATAPSQDTNSPKTARHSPVSSQRTERRSSKSERSSTMTATGPTRTSTAHHGTSSRRSHEDRGGLIGSSQAAQPPNVPRHDGRGESSSYNMKRPAETLPTEMSIPIRSHQVSPPKSREASSTIPAIADVDKFNDRHDHMAYQPSAHDDAAPPPVVPMNGNGEERRVGRSRHDHSRSHKGTSKFGDFILGNTIGEGEFGKVKLGWKQDSSVQVAIKLIKRDSVGGNPSRLSKIRREVTILRGVHHPNIVRLIDMRETDRYIGIILEYASGGELFDYILNHRYLKDHSARRLFSQLVSGVGYLHKKGIVHRDLKLENLLLDSNRNIIITDFGFANTFNPHEELTDEEELNLPDREYVRRFGLDKVKPNGMRRGDLMQTSCGSPCYAAPELVVSDSLYTGRKVDVWSCGVILYAMLAGYLPFDDDPANPEGDNINLLYKYIVSTPLTFPEYVTPHARDLLRRILVPNPRKRADLFEVARHSWLSEYAHVVEFITSSTTTPSEAQNASAHNDFTERSGVARSASVREASKHKSPAPPIVGGLAKAHAKIDQDAEQAYRTPKDAKRRTVQVEYVAPTTQTQRGSDPGAGDAQSSQEYQTSPPRGRMSGTEPNSRPGTSRQPQGPYGNPTPTRSSRETRAISDNAYVTNSATARPQTGGSMQSGASMALQSRGNYGQPAPPTIADTNAQGRIQQPSNAEDDTTGTIGRPSVGVPPKFARMSGFHDDRVNESKGHKRSSTIGEIGSKILGRSGSVFGGKSKKRPEQQTEKSKRYPPVSMSNTMPQGDEPGSRPSIESKASRRSFSGALGKKRSGSMTGSQGSTEKKDRRRFSLLPASFSLKSIGLGREYSDAPPAEAGRRADAVRNVTAPENARGSSPLFENSDGNPQGYDAAGRNAGHGSKHGSSQHERRRANAAPAHAPAGSDTHDASESSGDLRRPQTGNGSYGREAGEREGEGHRAHRGNLQKPHKRFTDAYEEGEYRGHEGSSGAAKRVMDFFRRRGRARGGDDR